MSNIQSESQREEEAPISLAIETNASDADDIDEPTPLPIAQLLSVYLIQFAEPVTATVIYPFINQFVRETGITKGDEGKTGYYAGLIESTFFLSECLTVVQWGYLSDRFGRRPILLCAPLGLSFAMLMFGSSTTFWSLMGARCLQGVFNGNLGVAKSIIAEMTDASNRAGAYGFMPVIWNSGITLGPLLGGVLSNAGQRWPTIFGRVPYINAHPYFLPCFIAAIFVFCTFVFAFLTLKETLPSLVAQEKLKLKNDDLISSAESRLIDHADENNYGTNSSESSSTSSSSPPSLLTPQQNGGFRSVATRPVLLTMLNQTFLTFMDMAHCALLPLMYSTPLEYGGLGLDPFRIGLILGTFGFCNSIFQAIFFRRIVKWFGARALYTFAFRNFILCLGMYPIMRFFAQRAQGVDYRVVACIVLQLGFGTSISLAYGSMHLLIIDSIPEGGSLGVINGVAQMIGSGMRTIAPTFAASLFAFSVERGLVGGNLVYCILIGMTVVGVRCTWLLPIKPLAPRRSRCQ